MVSNWEWGFSKTGGWRSQWVSGRFCVGVHVLIELTQELLLAPPMPQFAVGWKLVDICRQPLICELSTAAVYSSIFS